MIFKLLIFNKNFWWKRMHVQWKLNSVKSSWYNVNKCQQLIYFSGYSIIWKCCSSVQRELVLILFNWSCSIVSPWRGIRQTCVYPRHSSLSLQCLMMTNERKIFEDDGESVARDNSRTNPRGEDGGERRLDWCNHGLTRLSSFVTELSHQTHLFFNKYMRMINLNN